MAWMYQDTLATMLGVRRECICKVFGALVDRGHLFEKRQGRDKPNHYWMVLKEDNQDVRENTHHATEEASLDVRENAHHPDYDVRDQRLRCAQKRTETPITISGSTSCSPGEREAADAAASGDLGPDGPPRRQGKKKGSHRTGNASHSLAGSNGNAGDAVPHWQELALLRDTIWVRGHIPKPEQCKEEEDAWTAALTRGASPEAIIARAKKWAAVFKKFNGGLNFLPILAHWLNNNGWEKRPPKHKQANGSGGRRSHNGDATRDAVTERIKERLSEEEANHE